jgi:hypothetical protein
MVGSFGSFKSRLPDIWGFIGSRPLIKVAGEVFGEGTAVFRGLSGIPGVAGYQQLH